MIYCTVLESWELYAAVICANLEIQKKSEDIAVMNLKCS